MSADERDRLRRHMRAQRRSVPATERARVSVRIARIAQRHTLLRPKKHIAVYFAHGSEVDLSALMAIARKRACILYLPLITDYRSNRMDFARYDAGTRLVTNRYGIPEPERRNAARVPLRRLDLILVPLVAFDANGWRLGSGAGFYDRALRHLRIGRRWRRPQLIGIGYEFQRVPQLQPAPWDVPLDAVITEKNLYLAQQSRREHE